MAEHIKLKPTTNKDIENIKKLFIGEFADYIVEESTYSISGVSICNLAFEKYFVRSNSTAGLTVVIATDQRECYCDIISFAGGASFLNLSWGANKSFAELVSKNLLNGIFK